MEQQESGRLAGNAAAVAAVEDSTQRSVSPSSDNADGNSSNNGGPQTAEAVAANDDDDDDADGDSSSENDNFDDDDTDERSTDDDSDNSEDDNETDSNSAAVAATDEMPWGSSWWDKMPAEIRIMILDFVGPLQRFLTGQLGTKQQPARSFEGKPATVAIWVDALKRDWKGDLDLLPDMLLSVKEGLCEARSRSMYKRLCRRFRGYNRLIVDKPRKPSNLNTYHYKGRLSFRDQSLLHIPARHGWFDLLDFKHPITLGWFAIKHGHPALLRHLAFTLKVVDLSRFKRFRHENAMDVAASSGSLEIVQMLHDAGNNNCTADAMDWAAFCGHLDVMQWLHANRREGCTERASRSAAANGCLHVVEWLVEHYPSKIDKNAVIYAAQYGHVDVLAFLLPRFPDVNVQAGINDAAKNGHVDVLAFLLLRFPDYRVQAAMRIAAYNGHLTVIKCFHTHRPDAFTPLVFTEAVEQGHAGIVRFLLDSGYLFDVETLAKANNPSLKHMMVKRLTLERAQELLEDAYRSPYAQIINRLEAAVSRLEDAKAKAKAKADNEAIAK